MEKSPLRNLLMTAVALIALLGMSGDALAQQAPKKRPGPAERTLRNWNEVGNKLIAMAEDWPADKYDYRPNDQMRTFAEQLLHAAASNYYATNLAWGKKDNNVDENPSRTAYGTKEKVVEFVKKSVADGAAAVKHDGDAGVIQHIGAWEGIIEHMGEHYGQLVVYYRNNGVVPPASRSH